MLAFLLPRHSRITSRRSAISLLEVLFSIGVVIVGLLGVAILIPVGGKSAQDGATADRSARDGQNWVAEFQLRGFAQTGNWVVGVANPTTSTTATTVLANYTPNPAFPALPWQEQSFCIDPRAAAVNGDTTFPLLATNAPARMRRITLRSASNNSAGPMTREQAAEIFVSLEDLLFEVATDNNDPNTTERRFPRARQVFTGGSGQLVRPWSTADAPVKRQYEGKLSWMATLVPQLNDTSTGMYTLSVVVYLNRDPSFVLTPPGTTASGQPLPDNERVLQIPAANFFGGGISGGDMRLNRRTGRTSQDLKVKKGNWVMLSGFVPIDNNGTLRRVPIHKWYRVLSADDVDLSTNPTFIDVTLHGPDWNVQARNSPTGTAITQATIVNNVVAVLEKTIRLESFSLWTP